MKHKEKFILHKEKEVLDDPKFKELSNLFEKLFVRHGLFNKDIFDEKIWFLNRKLKENNFGDNDNSTPGNKILNTPDNFNNNNRNKLFEILKECNENENKFINEFPNYSNYTNNSFNTNINVTTTNFIYKLCEVLLLCNKIILRSEDTIKMYNAHQKVNLINENLKILNDRINKNNSENINKNEYISKFKLSLLKLENFPIGDYEFELKIMEFNLTDENNSTINNNTFISPREFHTKYFANNLITTKSIKLEDTIKVTTDSEKEIFLKTQNHNLVNYEFKLFDNKILESLSKNFSHSGTTFSNFKIKCLDKNNKNNYFETKAEYLLDLILIYIEDVYEISKKSITKNLRFKLSQNKSQSELGSDIKIVVESEVTVEMNLEFDDLTRWGVLRRVNDIFNGVIQNKRLNEDIIDEILDGYFPEEAEQIKMILLRKGEAKRDSCCQCLIY